MNNVPMVRTRISVDEYQFLSETAMIITERSARCFAFRSQKRNTTPEVGWKTLPSLCKWNASLISTRKVTSQSTFATKHWTSGDLVDLLRSRYLICFEGTSATESHCILASGQNSWSWALTNRSYSKPRPSSAHFRSPCESWFAKQRKSFKPHDVKTIQFRPIFHTSKIQLWF